MCDIEKKEVFRNYHLIIIFNRFFHVKSFFIYGWEQSLTKMKVCLRFGGEILLSPYTGTE